MCSARCNMAGRTRCPGDLHGVRRPMAEDGYTIHTQLLEQDLADRLHRLITPLLTGQSDAIRILGPAHYTGRPCTGSGSRSWKPGRPATWHSRGTPAVRTQRHHHGAPMTDHPCPTGCDRLGPGSGPEATTDPARLAVACELATQCPPSDTAFSICATIVTENGTEPARGYSRKNDPHDHTEEDALTRLGHDERRQNGATPHNSPEPCAKRASQPARPPSSSRKPGSGGPSPHGANPTPLSPEHRAPNSSTTPASPSPNCPNTPPQPRHRTSICCSHPQPEPPANPMCPTRGHRTPNPDATTSPGPSWTRCGS